MDNSILDNFDAVLEKSKAKISSNIFQLVSLCCSEPNNSNIVRTSAAIHDIYIELGTLRKVVMENLEPLYGEWGDEEPDPIILELWKKQGEVPAPVSSEIKNRLQRLRRTMAHLRTISSAVDSAKNIPDLLFNRSNRKNYLDQDAVWKAFEEIDRC